VAGALQAAALIVHCRLAGHDGATNLVASRLEPLRIATTTRSLDFR
jgi:hypothetical protein